MNALLFQENDRGELPRKAFIGVNDLPQGEGKISAFPNRASLIQLLSRLEFTRGVLRLLRHAQYEPERPGERAAHSATYLVDPRMTVEQLNAIATLYAEHTDSSMPMWHLDAIRCTCPADTECTELGLQDLRQDHSFDYVSPKKRLEEKHGPMNHIEGIQDSRLPAIVDMMEVIDPEGTADFDVRLNKRSAKEYGCVEVIDEQVRDAPYGAEHLPNEELKTLCYLVQPKGTPPFIIMVNTMADKRVAMGKVKKALEEAGWGRKFDIRPADIEGTFGIAKGEVHPLSLVPSHGEGPSTVIHLYDGSMRRKGYVTTNGGHPDWTTEFRRDTFIERMEGHFNSDGQPPLVIVTDINQDEEQSQAIVEETPQTWEHEKVDLILDHKEETGMLARKQKAAVLVTETTTLFAERIKAAIADPKLDGDGNNTALHIFRQTALDFEVVKFPQCWRTIFEQLAIAVATMVREEINVLFLDCNITPLEEMFSDRMPPEVRRHVITVLRSQLNDLLADVKDEDLISAITQKMSLLSKPVVVTDHLRREALKGRVKDIFLVGGSQISDPSMSKYHDGLVSINDLVTVHTLDPEQIRSAKLAMYFAEKKDADKGNGKVRQLYAIVKNMLPTIEKADRPLIVIASTSLSQAYHENGNQIIPESAVADLAEALGISVGEMAAERAKINAIPVLNTTEVYAQAAAEVLASNTTIYGYRYV